MKPLLKNNDGPKDGRKANIPKASTTQRTKSNFKNLLPFLFSLLLFFFFPFLGQLVRDRYKCTCSSSVAAENNK
ncbi:hypothetical protein PRUPE_3G238600 [Prunus persica]|uniref:Uncharacterized protein n=1 Tax=Prunus persica TaxID=3760 RepID=M5WRW2_PRUPE|nr:hypothetical protein PRUPE_3G238600 [Prunus persica]